MLVHHRQFQPLSAGPHSGGRTPHRLRLRGVCGSQPGMSWLDKAPLWVVVALAVWMAVAPIAPEPHLISKLRLLSQGAMVRPLDVFDLCLHLAPMLLLAWRLWRQFGPGKR